MRTDLAYLKRRERDWAVAPNDPGIAPGIRIGKIPLDGFAYTAVRDVIQKGRCAVCDRIFAIWNRRAEAADHDHSTGQFRGVICNGKKDCNMIVSRYERGQRKNLSAIAVERVEHYLANLPILRFNRAMMLISES